MPPITSPRRTAVHPTPSLARPMAIPSSTTSPLTALGTTPSSTGTSPSSLGSFTRPAPYMVALSGWPEPVFVAEARETWEKKHSRPPSPTGFREVRDGIGSFPIPSFSHRESQVREFRDGIPAPIHHPSQPQSFHRETTGNRTPPSRVPLPPLGAEVRDGIASDAPAAAATATATQHHHHYYHQHHPSYSSSRSSVGMARGASSNMGVDSRSGPSSPLRSSASPDAPSPPGSATHSHHSHHHSVSSTNSQPHSGNATPGGGASATSGSASHHPSSSSSAATVTAAAASLNSAAAAAAMRQRRAHGFVDPRYAPNAGVIGVRRAALRVAPAWSSASSTAPVHSVGSNHQHSHAHGHGSQPYPSASNRGGAVGLGHATTLRARDPRGLAASHYIQRSVPEVWPPPNAQAVAHTPHLATAVYPRDPDSPWMWNMSTPSAGHSPHHASAPHTPRSGMQSANGSVSPPSRRSRSPKMEDKPTDKNNVAKVSDTKEARNDKDEQMDTVEERERKATPTANGTLHNKTVDVDGDVDVDKHHKEDGDSHAKMDVDDA